MAIVAVQVKALRILTAVEGKARWVQARANPEVGVVGPIIFPQQLAHGQWPSGFVAVYARGEIQFFTGRQGHVSERQQIQAVGTRELFDLPTELARCLKVVAQDLLDVDDFTQVSALVPAETLDGMRHGEKLP